MRTAVVAGRPYAIDSARPVPKGWMVALVGVETREQADELRGEEVHALRSELTPLEQDEWYVVDLIGLQAVRPDGSPLGVVSDVANYGAGDILLLQIPKAPADREARAAEERMVPLTEGVLVSVHLDEGRIVVAPPEVE
jgi:16S rRNA processing protein RimM